MPKKLSHLIISLSLQARLSPLWITIENVTVQLTPRATWPYALNISYMEIKNRWGT